MKKFALVFTLFISVASITLAQQPLRTQPMRLTTQAFADGTIIPLKYTQASPGGAVSPELNWSKYLPERKALYFGCTM